MRLLKELVVTAENFRRKDNLSLVQTSTSSKDVEEQVELAHKGIDVVDRSNKLIFVILLPYNVDKAEKSNAQVRSFARERKYEEFQQIVFENNKVGEILSRYNKFCNR